MYLFQSVTSAFAIESSYVHGQVLGNNFQVRRNFLSALKGKIQCDKYNICLTYRVKTCRMFGVQYLDI